MTRLGDGIPIRAQRSAADPWEDWAETFAHYLHMSDTLDTTRNFGVVVEDASGAQTAKNDFDRLLSAWMNLTVALNALNRSMGLADAYPFALSDPVIRKLAFVHDLISGWS